MSPCIHNWVHNVVCKNQCLYADGRGGDDVDVVYHHWPYGVHVCCINKVCCTLIVLGTLSKLLLLDIEEEEDDDILLNYKAY